MKKIIIALLVLFFFASLAGSEEITLTWDKVDGVDGYFLFQTIREWNPETEQVEHKFDYNTPITSALYPYGKIPQDVNVLTIELPGLENDDVKYMFVARSFLGDEESVDSNEVAYFVSLVPPFPPDQLTGNFDKETGIITIAWDQPADENAQRKISHWIIYYRIDQGQWTPIGRINTGHELTMDAPFTAVSENENKDVDFVIVAYRSSGVYSSNSEILTVNVNRLEVPPVQNLKVIVEIPVE